MSGRGTEALHLFHTPLGNNKSTKYVQGDCPAQYKEQVKDQMGDLGT